MPRFSLIMPTKNRPEMLAEAVTALLAQDFTDWELFIVDGGDPVTFIWPDDERIKYIVQADPLDRRGNQALIRAQGDILNFHADDDTLTPGTLQYVHENIGAYKWMYGRINYGGKHLMGKPWDLERLKHENFVPAPAVFWTREARDIVGGWDIHNPRSHDWDYWLRLGVRWEPFYTERILANYRVHPSMATATMGDEYTAAMDAIVLERVRTGYYDVA